MHKKIHSILFTFIFLMPAFIGWAQDSTANKPVEMAGLMRSNGKIYVVVAVLVIILTGLFFYLVRLDRKINKMEKEFSSK